jgi:hypothetical protein
VLETSVGPLASMSWPVPLPPRLVVTRVGGGRRSDRCSLPPVDMPTLVWDSADRSSHWVRARKGLVLQFANLADARPAAFRRFAATWGPLALCSHGLPATHLPIDLIYDAPDISDCGANSRREEEIARWRQFATEANFIIRITAMLKDGIPSPRDLWEPMGHLAYDEPLEASIDWAETYAGSRDQPTRRQQVDTQRAGLEHWINWWLRVAGIGPALIWGQGLELVGRGSLFGAIAFQLAHLAHSEGNVSWCAVCGRLFSTVHKRQSGRNAYCNRTNCRERGRRRLSARKTSAIRRASDGQLHTAFDDRESPSLRSRAVGVARRTP